jgi:hypothetical protein
MATTSLFRKRGEQFFDSNGVVLSGGLIYYYQSGTTSQAYTYSEQTGVTQNTFPIVLDSSGRLQTAVFLGSDYDYKETLTDSSGNTISPWPFDGIPKAISTANPLTGFERLYQPWVLVNSASSPLTVTTAAVGNAYECDCTLGNLVINLPAVVTPQTGTGYTFKKIDSSANTVTINPNGADLIDGVNAAITIGAQNMCVGITNDNAQWLSTLFAALPYFLAGQNQSVTASTSSLSIDMRKGWNIALSLGATVTSFAVTNWPATGTVGKLTLDITNTGAYNITTWPTGTLWASGGAPTISSGAGKKDTIVLTSTDGGTTFRAFVASQNLS